MSTLFQSRPRVITFTVLGTPRPQGSTRAFIPKGWSRPVITTDNEKLKPWRQQISGQAVALNIEAFPAGVPLDVTLNFYFQKPKSVKRAAMTVKPDIDKLIRAIFDSLKSILIHDDAQVIEVHTRKHYGGPERVEISIQEAIP